MLIKNHDHKKIQIDNKTLSKLRDMCKKIDINLNSAEQKGLASIKNNDMNVNDLYVFALCVYQRIFINYIAELLNLKKYDNMLKNSESKLVPNEIKNYDVYQHMTNYVYKDELDFLYLRNNFFIERLENDELTELLNVYDSGIISNNAKDIVSSTWKKIIKYYPDKPDFMNVCYGPFTSSFFAPNNALVVGVYIDYFSENGLPDDEWRENFFNQLGEANNIIEIIDEECSSKIDIPFKIIRYDDSCIH